MALNQRLRTLFDENEVPHHVFPHREVFTAEEVARTSHVAGALLAKPIIIHESENRWYMAVVSAPQHVDLANIHRMTGRPRGRLATEEELRRLFPDCEVGAMPPFGWLYGMPMYIDEEFRRNDDIWFQAGNHREVVEMRFKDYEKYAGPFVGEFSLHREEAKIGN
jgi:Ala-tRNA(Pro) deacylase